MIDPISEFPESKKSPWYYGIGFVVAILVFVGPLGLPLVWKSPKFSLILKIVITILVCLATYYSAVGTGHAISYLMKQIEQMKQQGLI